jgi:hypothetical protein
MDGKFRDEGFELPFPAYDAQKPGHAHCRFDQIVRDRLRAGIGEPDAEIDRTTARIAYVSVLMIVVIFLVFEWELARGSSIEVARTAR